MITPKTSSARLLALMEELEKCLNEYHSRPMAILEDTQSRTAHLAMRSAMYLPLLLRCARGLVEAREALQAVANDDEAGKWGPDITTAGHAREALSRIDEILKELPPGK